MTASGPSRPAGILPESLVDSGSHADTPPGPPSGAVQPAAISRCSLDTGLGPRCRLIPGRSQILRPEVGIGVISRPGSANPAVAGHRREVPGLAGIGSHPSRGRAITDVTWVLVLWSLVPPRFCAGPPQSESRPTASPAVPCATARGHQSESDHPSLTRRGSRRRVPCATLGIKTRLDQRRGTERCAPI